MWQKNNFFGHAGRWRFGGTAVLPGTADGASGGGGDTAASGCDGKALLRREGVVAALTPNRPSVHSTCRRGRHFAVLDRFPCRVDAKSAVCAFYVSTRPGPGPGLRPVRGENWGAAVLESGRWRFGGRRCFRGRPKALPGGGCDTAASGCDGKALLRREGVVAALTPNRHSVHSTCRRGRHFAVLGRFPCRVDAKSAVCAFYVSTRQGAAPAWCRE